MTDIDKATSDAWTQGYACAVATLIRMDSNDPEDPDVTTEARELLGAGPVPEDLKQRRWLKS